MWVVALTQRVGDDIWVATLDRRRDGPGGPGGSCRRCSSYEQGRAGAELWVARHEARLREDVAKITAYREVVRANRLAKLHTPPSFGWRGRGRRQGIRRPAAAARCFAWGAVRFV